MKLMPMVSYCALLSLVIAVSHAQQTITVPVTEYKVVFDFFSPGNYSYGSSDTYGIGNKYWSSGPQENRSYRTLFKFDLSSVPTNAIITNASLKSWVTGYEATHDQSWWYVYRVKLTAALVDPQQLGYESCFNNASVGDSVTERFYTDTIFIAVTSKVQSRLSQRYVVFGGTSNIEDGDKVLQEHDSILN